MSSPAESSPDRPGDLISRRTFLAGVGSLSLVGAGCAAAETAARRPPPPGHRRSPRKLEEAIRGPVIRPGDPGFDAAAHVYNEAFDYLRPRAVAQPLDPHDVASAVRWAFDHGVPVRARSGGHSYAGYSTFDGGVVLDLRRMRRIEIHRHEQAAVIGTGAQLIDVYAQLAQAGATIPAGSCPSVGLGGHALGGGMGLAGRAFGLTLDNVMAVELVRADGRTGWVDDRSDPELFWALRGGGGGNFGVATRFRLRLHKMPHSAAWFFITWPWSSASDALDAWQHWAPHATDRVTSVFHLQTGGPVVSTAGQYLGRATDLPHLLTHLTSVPGASVSTGEDGYLPLQLRWAGCLGQPVRACHTAGTRAGGTLSRALFDAKSDYVNASLPPAARRQLIDAINAREGQTGSGAILLDSYGGAINRVAADHTAFIHRDDLFCVQYLSYGGGSRWLTQTHAGMRRYVSGMAYQNYIDPDLKDWRKAYYGAHYPRLVAVQRRVDPHHKFRFPQAIGG